MAEPARDYAVNEHTPDPSVVFDRAIGETYLRYARMLVDRGYVQSSLTFSYLMQKPARYLPAHLNVEEDVAPIKTFIQDTNCIIMKRHGFTVLGRTVSEAYHRTNVLVSEVKRNVLVELLCAAKGTKP